MAGSRVFEDPFASNRRPSSKAGTISRIRLENFMCHSNLEIEFGDYVNFITGQNGSGKSAILTALCVAFGSRARSTQRASSLKDFIKTDCHYAVVVVQIKNQGEDAFRYETLGDAIIIERRISDSGVSVITIKDHLGRKVATGKEKLRELIEHFNIDVENPCVIMTQDKSREFLHSGSGKDKFQFFYKATLLQVLDELLKCVRTSVEIANGLVAELEKSIEPVIKELNELERKIESHEQVERISDQLKQLRKQLAWALVYDDDKKLQEQGAKVEKFKKNKPQCEARINKCAKILEDLRECYLKKEADSQHLLERSREVTKRKEELCDQIRKATIEKRQLEDDHRSKREKVQELKNKLKKLEQLVLDTQEQHFRDTQAEENEMQENLKVLEDEIKEVTSLQMRLSDEENSLLEAVRNKENEIREMREEIESKKRKLHDISSKIRELEKSQNNKVNAFGGAKVYQLLQVLERHHHKFRQPPIGPLGAHLNLINNDYWAGAVENAVGGLFNSFIVTDHKDSLLLRSCAREAQYHNLNILIYDFSRPRINIPPNMLPQTNHPSVLSVLHSDNPTVMNVLVDMASAERQVLVKDYDVGKGVAFVQKIPNLKEVYTRDGYKMFSRGSVQSTLPPPKWARNSRLCSSYADQIEELKTEHATMEEQIQCEQRRKRTAEGDIDELRGKKDVIKRRRLNLEKDLSSKKLDYQGLKDSYANLTAADPVSSVDEVSEEISIVRSEIQDQETILEKLIVLIEEVGAKVRDLKESFDKLRESAQAESDAMSEVDKELQKIQDQIKEAGERKRHYEKLLVEKVQSSIEAEQEEFQKLEKKREEDIEKATQICPESEVKALGGCEDRTPEQLANQLNRLKQRLRQESHNFSDSLEDLRFMYNKKQKKIQREQRLFEDFRQKLSALENALNVRQKKFERSATYLSRELTWKFNTHLGRKGISGKLDVDYNQKTLSIEVTMPQDGSLASVRDTRGLSGGERSFSTLCFALTLHSMTESPFRAMDEFDVFMDAVSRKISLDALLEFALAEGSQWIFITPHDISMVKQGDRVKKQQMAAPRS